MNYAEALVECGYAEAMREPENGIYQLYPDKHKPHYEWCKPFADTLEGRRQADALEDWLDNLSVKKFLPGSIWEASIRDGMVFRKTTKHQWRLDRIKWCFEQMEKQE